MDTYIDLSNKDTVITDQRIFSVYNLINSRLVFVNCTFITSCIWLTNSHIVFKDCIFKQGLVVYTDRPSSIVSNRPIDFLTCIITNSTGQQGDISVGQCPHIVINLSEQVYRINGREINVCKVFKPLVGYSKDHIRKKYHLTNNFSLESKKVYYNDILVGKYTITNIPKPINGKLQVSDLDASVSLDHVTDLHITHAGYKNLNTTYLHTCYVKVLDEYAFINPVHIDYLQVETGCLTGLKGYIKTLKIQTLLPSEFSPELYIETCILLNKECWKEDYTCGKCIINEPVEEYDIFKRVKCIEVDKQEMYLQPDKRVLYKWDTMDMDISYLLHNLQDVYPWYTSDVVVTFKNKPIYVGNLTSASEVTISSYEGDVIVLSTGDNILAKWTLRRIDIWGIVFMFTTMMFLWLHNFSQNFVH